MTLKYRAITDEQRREEVLKYVRKYPHCDLEDIINQLTDTEFGSRVTIRRAVAELLESGKLNDGKSRKNAKSYQFTVVEDNPLLTMPTDLKLITSKFEIFLSVIRKLKKSEKIVNRLKESNLLLSESFGPEEIVKTIPFFPYEVIGEIDRIYKFKLLIMLPTKIHRQTVLNNLYSLYFESLTNLYLMTAGETQKAHPSVTNLPTEENYLIRAYRNIGTGFTSHMVEVCRVLNIESELYDVLDQAWLRNIEVCPFLYDLQWDLKLMNYQQALEKFAPKYNDLVNKNEILKNIHLKTDSEVFLFEETYSQIKKITQNEDVYGPFYYKN